MNEKFFKITIREDGENGEAWDMVDVFTSREDVLEEARKWDYNFEREGGSAHTYYHVTIKDYTEKPDGPIVTKVNKGVGANDLFHSRWKSAKQKVEEYLILCQKTR